MNNNNVIVKFESKRGKQSDWMFHDQGFNGIPLGLLISRGTANQDVDLELFVDFYNKTRDEEQVERKLELTIQKVEEWKSKISMFSSESGRGIFTYQETENKCFCFIEVSCLSPPLLNAWAAYHSMIAAYAEAYVTRRWFLSTESPEVVEYFTKCENAGLPHGAWRLVDIDKKVFFKKTPSWVEQVSEALEKSDARLLGYKIR